MEIISNSYNGDGYGILNNKKIFIPKTITGDIVEYEIVKNNKNYIIGKLTKLIRKSDRRIDAKCPYYNNCGGCNLLHFNKEEYYNFKKNKLIKYIKETKYSNINELIENLQIITIDFNSRRRVTFKVQSNKIGFFEKNTTNLIEINNCCLINNNINNILLKLNPIIKSINNIIEISITNFNNGLDILFNITKEFSSNEVKILNKFIFDNQNIISINYKINNDLFLLFQKEKPFIFLKDKKIELESNIFLQATEKGQNEIINILIDNLKNYKNIIDLYCGIGTYTFPLSDFSNIYSIEGNQNMIDILNKNIKKHNLKNKIKAKCQNLITQPLLKNELNNYNVIVINPPRNGAQIQCKEIAKSNVKKIIIVSCNPQTFSIDANELRNGNYNLKQVIGIDQFFQTEHIEMIGIFEKST